MQSHPKLASENLLKWKKVVKSFNINISNFFWADSLSMQNAEGYFLIGTSKQESPPAWTQEAYRQPCSKYSSAVLSGGGVPQHWTGGTWTLDGGWVPQPWMGVPQPWMGYPVPTLDGGYPSPNLRWGVSLSMWPMPACNFDINFLLFKLQLSSAPVSCFLHSHQPHGILGNGKSIMGCCKNIMGWGTPPPCEPSPSVVACE